MVLEYPQYCQLLAIIVGVVTYKQHQQFALKVLLIFCCITLSNEILAIITWEQYHKSTHILYNIYNVVRCACFIWLFKAAIEQVRYIKIITYITYIIIAISVASYYIHQSIFIYNAVVSEVFLIGYIICSGVYFIDLITNNSIVPLKHQPLFFIVIGILFYSLILVVRYAIWGFIGTVPNYDMLVKITNVISNTLLYGFIILSFLCPPIKK